MTLSIGGRDFPTRRVSASWHLMKFSQAQRMMERQRPHRAENDLEVYGGDCDRCKKVVADQERAGTLILTAMYNACMALIEPDLRDEFEEYMNDVELAPGELEQAIAAAVASAGSEDDLPEEEGKSHEEASPSASSGSSETTSASSRVVSFARDESRVVDAT